MRFPAPVLRAQLRAACSAALKAALHAESVEQTDLKHATGASLAVVHRWTDANEATSLSVADLVLIAQRGYPGVARRMLAWAAEQLGYELRAVAALDDAHDEGATATAAIHEALDVIRAATMTQADGEITQAEAVEELRQWDELDAAAARRRAVLRKAAGLGVIAGGGKRG